MLRYKTSHLQEAIDDTFFTRGTNINERTSKQECEQELIDMLNHMFSQKIGLHNTKLHKSIREAF